MKELEYDEDVWQYSWDEPQYYLYKSEVVSWMDADITESRLAKYWASEEMTYTILANDPDCYMDDFERRIYSFEYKGFLSQLLKKEWFRS